MKSSFVIHGFAIVSVEGMIADAQKMMPSSLKFEADHVYFEHALAQADLIVHGRHSYEGHTGSAKRRRFWLTRAVAAHEPDPSAGPSHWLWNPEGRSLEEAAKAVGLERGVVAVLGGTAVYDMFLPFYDVFYLSRAGTTSIPGGTPVFSAVAEGLTPGETLMRQGLEADPTVTLDAGNKVTVTRWLRRR